MLARDLSPASANADEEASLDHPVSSPQVYAQLGSRGGSDSCQRETGAHHVANAPQVFGAFRTMLESQSHDLRPGGSAPNGLDCKYLELWAPATEILVFRGG